MSDFSFKRIWSIKDEKELQKGFFLWILHADKVPPHVGCSIDGNYYSLKVSGKDEGVNVAKVQTVIEKKGILTIVVSVNTTIDHLLVQQVFRKFDAARSDMTTCLSPLIEVFGLEKQGIEKLSLLLKYLESKHRMGKVFGLNLTEGYIGIPEYDLEDIHNRLRKLENVQVKASARPVG